MGILQRIRDVSSQRLTHQLLSSLLKEYKRPNDKIHGTDFALNMEKLLLASRSGRATKPREVVIANEGLHHGVLNIRS